MDPGAQYGNPNPEIESGVIVLTGWDRPIERYHLPLLHPGRESECRLPLN